MNWWKRPPQNASPVTSKKITVVLAAGVAILSATVPLEFLYGFEQPQLVVPSGGFASLEISKADATSALYVRVIVDPGPPVDIFLFDIAGYELYLEGRWTWAQDYVGVKGLYDELYLVAGTYFFVVDNSNYGRTRPTGDVALATYAIGGGNVVSVTGEIIEGSSPVMTFGLLAAVIASVVMIVLSLVGFSDTKRQG